MRVPANFQMFHSYSCWFMFISCMFLLIPESFLHIPIHSCMFYICSCLFPHISYVSLLISACFLFIPKKQAGISRNEQEHVKNKKQEAGMWQKSLSSYEKFMKIPRNYEELQRKSREFPGIKEKIPGNQCHGERRDNCVVPSATFALSPIPRIWGKGPKPLFLVACTQLYTLPCRKVCRSHFWIASGFRITAPAQPSATGLPCIQYPALFFQCFAELQQSSCRYRDSA